MRPCRLALALLLLSFRASAADAKAEPITAIVGGTVLPSPTARPIPGGVVLLQGNKVLAVGTAEEVSVPAKAVRIDAKGLQVSAGFWNSHVHFSAPQWLGAADAEAQKLTGLLEQMLCRYGFTTVLDAGSDVRNTVALRARVEKGDVRGPRILTAGDPLFPVAGIPIYLKETLPPAVLAQLLQPATAAEARADVERNLLAGADATKVFAGSWQGRGKTLEMDGAILRAAADATHAAHKQVLAHPQSLQGVQLSIDGGVDVLMHTTPGGGPWDDALVKRLLAAHMAVVPTLGLWMVVAKQGGSTPAQAEAFVQGGVAQLRAFAKAGGEVLFGTDVGFTEQTDTGEELVRMAQAGLGWRDVLASLTTAPARRFGGGGTGTLAKGEPADVVLFSGEPMKDPRAFSHVVLSLRAGQVLYRAPK
jgi:imidazolonepropionase-like amidohydrolase